MLSLGACSEFKCIISTTGRCYFPRREEAAACLPQGSRIRREQYNQHMQRVQGRGGPGNINKLEYLNLLVMCWVQGPLPPSQCKKQRSKTLVHRASASEQMLRQIPMNFVTSSDALVTSSFLLVVMPLLLVTMHYTQPCGIKGRPHEAFSPAASRIWFGRRRPQTALRLATSGALTHLSNEA